jgi:alkanesulfonate monooxygenase SsuD/methylene tetrahydromethanopterin reductase-like flavin-dependent oxidoreductase (luciferase family)
MRVGVQVFASLADADETNQPLHRAVEVAALAERLGFDALWVAEHHTTRWNLCSDPLLLLAHIAARTERIRLGTAVVNLTLHHPVEVAERALLVDALSQGRLELGIGRGFARADYALYGVDKDRDHEIFTRHHDQLVHALAGEGLEFRLAGVQRPWPPMWLAVTGNLRSIELAAEMGYGLLMAGNADKLRTGLAHYRTQWSLRQTKPSRVSITRAVHLSGSPQEAWNEIVGHVQWYMDQLERLQPDAPRPSLEAVREGFCILGSPGDCSRQLQALHADTGLTDLTCVFGIGAAPPAVADQAMQSFARNVLPALHTLG